METMSAIQVVSGILRARYETKLVFFKEHALSVSSSCEGDDEGEGPYQRAIYDSVPVQRPRTGYANLLTDLRHRLTMYPRNIACAFIAGLYSEIEREPLRSSFHTACGVPRAMTITLPAPNAYSFPATLHRTVPSITSSRSS